MKKLLIAVCAFFSFAAQAQQNVLLEQSFWKTAPDVNAVKAEIEKGSNPSQFNNNMFDPVVLAINAGAPNPTIEYLLTQPGNTVDKATHDGRIYLHWAAMRGNVELMKYLVAKGSKGNYVDGHGATPINFAAGGGQQNTKVYDICLAHGADLKKDLNNDGANALLIGIANDKDLALTNYFISKGLDLKSTDAAGNNAFSYAARAGKIDVLKALLAKGVPANSDAILMAAQGSRGGANSIEVYQYLESLKLKPTVIGKNGENALHAIVRKPKQEEIIRYFLSKGVDVNKADEDGNTVFMNAAASNRDTATIGILLSTVKNVNQVNEKGVSALAMAVRGNSPEVISYLIGKGADINTTDKNGDNLAFYLTQSYNGRTANEFGPKVKVLQDKGFKIAAPAKNGNTLYHVAVAKNDLALVKLLEAYQIDVNAKNAEGITALHKAAMVSKDDAMLKYLLSIGAKKDIETNFKETAFDLAGENESLSRNNITVQFLK
ncbi:ankyrin repeat domain-containing protein [Dyadobacter fanqingshengii]|uniref:Ankyrin repeat domain-containing protein n=1 Tax=Dyadobacter fanqingshengii TaxID=2906443 RepID=A0A9X1T8M6_9BACT|nr:ankyrin repeat domain-containing protein [Dyadobacter fanqingshengii]MCF0039816.1 ankyrin repeat domain-containing protein [Dyadobacter fanqingshengii]USJ38421.1 ankyrin repeat domain-containing protein [Dyadobacter fanqingshengii]